MKEGVDEAPGEVDLRRAPLVHGVVVDSLPVVEGLVLAEQEEPRKQCRGHQRQGQPPAEAPDDAAPCQKPEKEDAGHDAGDAQELLSVRPEVIVLPGGDGQPLLQAPQVLEHQGVVPELQHRVIAKAEADHEHAAGQKGGPCPAIEAEEKGRQHHDRGDVQKKDPGVAEVAEADRQAVGPGGVEKA